MYICPVCNSVQTDGPAASNLCPYGHPMTRDSVVNGVLLGIAGGVMTGVLAGVPGLHSLASPAILLIEGFAVATLIRGLEKPQPTRRLNRIPAAMALTLPCICLAVSSVLGRFAGFHP
jgi:hypothetical protein